MCAGERTGFGDFRGLLDNWNLRFDRRGRWSFVNWLDSGWRLFHDGRNNWGIDGCRNVDDGSGCLDDRLLWMDSRGLWLLRWRLRILVEEGLLESRDDEGDEEFPTQLRIPPG